MRLNALIVCATLLAVGNAGADELISPRDADIRRGNPVNDTISVSGQTFEAWSYQYRIRGQTGATVSASIGQRESEYPDWGGDVTLVVSGINTFHVNIPNDRYHLSDYSPKFATGMTGPAWTNTDFLSSAILGASLGFSGRLVDDESDLTEAGDGGNVTLTINNADIRLGNYLDFDENVPDMRLMLNGVMAWSEGGLNDRFNTGFLGGTDTYSQSGDAGNVIVDFSGNIAAVTDTRVLPRNVDRQAIIFREVGITAVSRGGPFRCIYYDCKENYGNDYNTLPGQGGDVTVTLEDGIIDLTLGSAIGILALSANGPIISDIANQPEYRVDTSSVQAGEVTVTVGSNATISVGQDDSDFSAGVLAVSAGSDASVPLSYQDHDNTLLIPAGGAGYGDEVTVTNRGTVSSTGELALGVAALSLGGDAVLGVEEAAQVGTYTTGKHTPTWDNLVAALGDVTIENHGKITARGDTSIGILAASLNGGGITLFSSVDAAYDRETCRLNDTDGNVECTDDGGATYTETAIVLGAEGGTPRNAGTVTVTNDGAITSGFDPDGDDDRDGTINENDADFDPSYHAMGILAQSVGGSGGSAHGSGLFRIGGTKDKDHSGANGNSVTVTSWAPINTFGDHGTAIVAQSIGGDGGAGGSNVFPVVSVGGAGGDGGEAGEVTVTLDDSSTITTDGAFAQGVLAQSIGGGGGKGGSSTAPWFFAAVSVGGGGGDGGSSGSVTVSANNNVTPISWDGSGEVPDDPGYFEILTKGHHSPGLLAQSIGGGGGVGGAAHAIVLAIQYSAAVAVGGGGGDGGKGAKSEVTNLNDIQTRGGHSPGIQAQSIGGGGGAGGSALVVDATVEVPAEAPALTLTVSVGGKGGDGNTAGSVTVYNGGMIYTADNDGAGGSYGILAQSIGGGGGAGGHASNRSFAVPALPADVPQWGFNFAVAVGGKGGTGGHGETVTVRNAAGQKAGTIITDSDYGAGLLAQSIGGGGGSGGQGKSQQAVLNTFKVVAKSFFGAASGPKPSVNVAVSIGVGGRGGAGGNGNSVDAHNGNQVLDGGGYSITPGYIETKRGSSPGMQVQSIGGGGGAGGGGTARSFGANFALDMSIGGAGGAAGDGGHVYALNPRGATIKTGVNTVVASAQDTIDAGAYPYYFDVTGASSVGILAQSIGGGGGSGGSADAHLGIYNDWARWAQTWFNDVAFITFFDSLKGMTPEERRAKLPGNLGGSLNLSIGGKGLAGGDGGVVLVDNGGSIATIGEQAHGIHAQSIGGGGGTGGSVIQSDAPLSTDFNFMNLLRPIDITVAVGGNSGASGSGGEVTVNHYPGASIGTKGYGATGILAQSVGGGGGYAGAANVNGTGLLTIGSQRQGSVGVSGKGSSVIVKGQGTIITSGNDAPGILGQSIGGGGGHLVAGCSTNDFFDFNVVVDKTPCSNQIGSQDGKTSSDDSGPAGDSYRSFSINMGGHVRDSDEGNDGGSVEVVVKDAITTYGARSMGVIAQSIGGGGGYFSTAAADLKVTHLAPRAGLNHSHGSKVTVTLGDANDFSNGGVITTYGDGAWGVLAQSIGGSGGFAADPALNLDMYLYNSNSNTLKEQCCGTFNNGADAGYPGGTDSGLSVTLYGGSSIRTFGKNAHGIFAQSVGGGGGIGVPMPADVAGLTGDQDGDGIYNMDDSDWIEAQNFTPPEVLYAGNTMDESWNYELNKKRRNDDGEPTWKWTGRGGQIDIVVDAGAIVEVLGENSVGIIAQSTGQKDKGSTINITVGGTVIGGSGEVSPSTETGPRAILVSGGAIELGPKFSQLQWNSITVQDSGVVEGWIQANHGYTKVFNQGSITGSVKLETFLDGGYFNNKGGAFWYMGASNWIGQNAGSTKGSSETGLHNRGTLIIRGHTKLFGSLTNYSDGTMKFEHPTPNGVALSIESTSFYNSEQPRVELEPGGKFVVVTDTATQGDQYTLIRAEVGIEGNPTQTTVDGAVTWNFFLADACPACLNNALVAEPIFNPDAVLNLGVTSNQQSVLKHLEQAWYAREEGLGKHFGYMLALKGIEGHGAMLDALSGAPLLHQQTATLQALPVLLSDTLECPTGGAQSIIEEGSCFWIKGGHQWGRYSGDDAFNADIDSDFYGFGGQKEVQPGWFLSGAFGQLDSDVKANGFRSFGDATVGSVGLKYQTGRWTLGAAFALASGSYENIRDYTLPEAGDGVVSAFFEGRSEALHSDSDLDVQSLRLQASREFAFDGWYVRPILDVDVTRTEMPGFEENGPEDILALRVAGDSETHAAATPHVEIGSLHAVGKESNLRTYLDLGVRWAPDADREIAYTLKGVSEASGYVRQQIDVPHATGLLKAGVQVYRKGGLDFRLEYSLLDNSDVRSQSVSARLGWQF